MFVHRSNRAEVLVEELAALVSKPIGSPMAPECISVQGPGMQRWLAMELSSRLGVWANAEFPFPRALVDQAIGAVLGDGFPATGAFDAGPLLWAVAAELKAGLQDPAYGELRHYLSNDPTERKLFQLADRVARVFDRYTVYRPDVVSAWEAGDGSDWQAALWRALSGSHGSGHMAGHMRRFFEEVQQGSGPIEGFPARVSLFGVSALPPSYTQVLAALSERIEVHMFVLSPSRQYWADVARRGGVHKLQTHDIDGSREHLHIDEGNPLLSSLGRLSGDFQLVLENHAADYQETGRDLYIEPPDNGTMLSVVQADILDLRHRRPVVSGMAVSDRQPPALVLRPDDETITVHSCHSPMRELEVLHDQLVALFDADSSLEARDIVVMAPSIEAYAPLIDSVFGSDSRDRPRIPYRIADRADRSTYPVLQAFSTILATVGGRMTAPEVLDVLALDPVQARFDVDDDDMARIRRWVIDTGIRWGVDAEHRGSVAQPDFEENTWRFGLDRLLLGYAVEGEGRDLFGEILPYDDIEGSSAELLGRFVDFCETLFCLRKLFSTPKSVSEWEPVLLSALDGLVAVTENNHGEHQLVRDALGSLVRHAGAGGFGDAVPFETILSLLDGAWESAGTARGFMAGGATFCQLMPMRSIPFRVVCVLGMDDAVFPRCPQPLGFDLVAAKPRIGDRTPRDDDRYLFLEALLSARDRLLVTYVGQSIQNNVALPPSVLVGELLDVLDESFMVPEVEDGVRGQVFLKHPLQPFSPRYFGAADDTRLFSYSVAYAGGASSLAQPKRGAHGFLSGPLTLEVDVSREVSVSELARFFMRPTRRLIEGRLGLYLFEDDLSIADREPLSLGGLTGWRVGNDLLARALQGQSLKQFGRVVRAAGTLPLGSVGECVFDDVQTHVSALAALVRTFQSGDPLPELVVDMVMDGTRITGALNSLWTGAAVQSDYSRLGRKAELGHWIRHVLLCLVAPKGYPKRTVLVGRAEKGEGASAVEFECVSEPAEIIAGLLKLYWVGQVAPLPLFPETGRHFVGALKGADGSDTGSTQFGVALKSAYSAFDPSFGPDGEARDPYVQKTFDVVECLDPDYRPFDGLPGDYQAFPELSLSVFAPLLTARTKPK